MKNIIKFGQYKGKSIQWIIENDKQYAEWLASTKSKNFNKTKKSIRDILKENLNAINSYYTI